VELLGRASLHAMRPPVCGSKEENMMSLKDAATGLFIRVAIGAGMLCTGKLQGRAVGTPEANGARSWLLQGQLHFQMFELHRNAVPMQHASGVACTGGIKHLVLCQRLGRWEHRFVIQLLGSTMREFIAEGRETAAHLVLQNNLSEELTRVWAPADWAGAIRRQDIGAVPSRPKLHFRRCWRWPVFALGRAWRESPVPRWSRTCACRWLWRRNTKPWQRGMRASWRKLPRASVASNASGFAVD
jgi:hypothetical protein